MKPFDPDLEDDAADQGETIGGGCPRCGCWPCVCEDSDDFCTACGNRVEDCTCDFDVIDDMDANTEGDIA